MLQLIKVNPIKDSSSSRDHVLSDGSALQMLADIISSDQIRRDTAQCLLRHGMPQILDGNHLKKFCD